MDLSLGIALLALAVNALSYLDRRRAERRDMFLNLHERLLALAEGRRVIYEKCTSVDAIEQLRKSDPESYQLANRSLALLDVLGIYFTRGYIDQKDLLEVWGRTLARLDVAAAPFFEFRAEEYGADPWPSLRRLCEAGTRWTEERDRALLR